MDLYFSYGVIYCVVWKKKITIEVPGSDRNNIKYGQVARSRVGVENLIPVWDFNINLQVCMLILRGDFASIREGMKIAIVF